MQLTRHNVVFTIIQTARFKRHDRTERHLNKVISAETYCIQPSEGMINIHLNSELCCHFILNKTETEKRTNCMSLI